MGRADLLEQIDLIVLAHDIDETESVLLTDAGQHLAEVRRPHRVQDRVLPVHLGVLGEPQRGHRIDEGARAVLGGVIAQRQAHLRIGGAILAVGVARHAGDALPHQRLGRVAVTGRDNGARALVARGQLEAVPCFRTRVERLGHLGHEFAGRIFRVLHIRCADEDREVGRIDRSRLHLHEDLVAGRIGEVHVLDRDGERTVCLQRREQLLASGRHVDLQI